MKATKGSLFLACVADGNFEVKISSFERGELQTKAPRVRRARFN